MSAWRAPIGRSTSTAWPRSSARPSSWASSASPGGSHGATGGLSPGQHGRRGALERRLGLSVDYPLDADDELSDADLRRIAVEVVRAGGLRGLEAPDLRDDAFAHDVVDRFDTTRGGRRNRERVLATATGG